MKIRIQTDPGGKHDLIATQRDTVTGRDIVVQTISPGAQYEFDITSDISFSASLGVRVLGETSDAGVDVDPPRALPLADDDEFDDDDAEVKRPEGGPSEGVTQDPASINSPTAPVPGSSPTQPPEIVFGRDALSSPENDASRLDNVGENEAAAAAAGGDTLAGGSSESGDASTFGGDTASGGASEGGAAGSDAIPSEPSDDDVRAVLDDLEGQPSVERTQAGLVQVATINKALEARGFKPINAEKRDALAAG